MNPSEYVRHMLKAIERIERFTEDIDELGFLQSELVQDAVLRNIEVLGEAAHNIRRCAPEFADMHADIPWEVLYAWRNQTSHAYHKIDLSLIWRATQTELPELHFQLAALLPD